MAFGAFWNRPGGTPMSEINMVPLIDVMLVLLVIFIITAPLLTHAVKLDLPRAASQVNQTQPDNIQLAIDGDGRIYWNGQQVDKPTMIERLAVSGKLEPQPELHLRADRETRYQALAEVMAEAAKANVTKIGFVSDPRDAE